VVRLWGRLVARLAVSGWDEAGGVGGAAVRMRRVDADVTAGCSAREQEALQRGGAQMPRLRWARIVERLAVPKSAAMMGNVGAAVRCRTVARRWRP
jgi:hypothetical protein